MSQGHEAAEFEIGRLHQANEKLRRDLHVAQMRILALQEQIMAHLEDPAPLVAHATHVHTKSGERYEVLSEDVKMQAYWPVADMQPLALYRSCANGSLWVRPLPEFEDRFTPVDKT